LTHNYHNGGGCMVIANGLEHARDQLITAVATQDSDVFTKEPSFVAPVECDEDKVFIFPDAGCC
jgi:hypothetical protein